MRPDEYRIFRVLTAQQQSSRANWPQIASLLRDLEDSVMAADRGGQSAADAAKRADQLIVAIADATRH